MSLAWGRHYVMVEPSHFRIEYVINPFMDPAEQPDRDLALAQWRTLVETIERLGGTVDVIPQRPDAPGHGLRDEPRPRRGTAPR